MVPDPSASPPLVVEAIIPLPGTIGRYVLS